MVDDITWYFACDLKKALKYKCVDGSSVSSVSPCNKLRLCFEASGGLTHCTGINEQGVRKFLLSSRKRTNQQLNEYFDINIKTSSMLCKESQIGTAITEAFEEINIVPQYKVISWDTTYYIDYYMPDHKLAIEMDEFGHDDRDSEYEADRQDYIENKLKCKFIRCNPDDPKFNIFQFIYKLRMLLKTKD